MLDIVFPEYAEDGEGQAKVLEWYAKPGDKINEGDELVELLSDKASFELNAPADGVLKEIHAKTGEQVCPGAVLGVMET